MRTLTLALLAAGTVAVSDATACRLTAAYDDYPDAWRGRRPIGVIAWSDGCPITGPVEVRDMYLATLAPDLGPRVGYKAGLTTAAAQARFGASGPLLGLLFANMILPDGAEVPASFGARPVWEADLLFVVKDDGINAAATREEALAHLRALRPFIELPDLAYAPDVKMSARDLQIVNVAARLGVAGAEVPLAATPETVGALAAMRVIAADEAGATLAEGRGADVLGHPLDAVLWVRDAAAKEGRRLKAGDLISIGAFTPLTPPRPGQTVRVRYEGLPGDPSVSVGFR